MDPDSFITEQSQQNGLERLRTDDGYVRPKFTKQDKLSEDQIEDLLTDYIDIDKLELGDIPTGTEIRYVVIEKYKDENGKQYVEKKFRYGGTLLKNNEFTKYIVLTNRGKSWSVPTSFATHPEIQDILFYKKLSIDEIKEEYDLIITELKSIIKKQKKEITNLNKEIDGYKQKCKSRKSKKSKKSK